MKALCIGGYNDGRRVEVDEFKLDGETHSLTYREKLQGPGLDETEPYLLEGPETPLSDARMTFRSEQYTVRDIRFKGHTLVRVLVIDPSADYVWILKALINGYRKPKETQA